MTKLLRTLPSAHQRAPFKPIFHPGASLLVKAERDKTCSHLNPLAIKLMQLASIKHLRPKCGRRWPEIKITLHGVLSRREPRLRLNTDYFNNGLVFFELRLQLFERNGIFFEATSADELLSSHSIDEMAHQEFFLQGIQSHLGRLLSRKHTITD